MKTKKQPNTQENPPYFDEDEREIIEAVDRGEFKRVPNFETRKKELEQMAREDLTTKQAISVRIQRGDLSRIKRLAQKDGIPYQTLISSIVHRYAEGTLKRND
jgi:predicted DNA binding CopG/RHH family protein